MIVAAMTPRWVDRRSGRSIIHPIMNSVSQSVISRSRPALTPPPPRSPAPPLPVNHKYRVLAPGGYSLSQVRSVSPSGQGIPCRLLPCTRLLGRDCVRTSHLDLLDLRLSGRPVHRGHKNDCEKTLFTRRARAAPSVVCLGVSLSPRVHAAVRGVFYLLRLITTSENRSSSGEERS